jgi:RNA polymerase sigma-70 factor (ECF subfamily)
VSATAANPEMPAVLDRARSGDRDAFASLVRAHQGSVFSIGLRMLSRRDLAEDLAQDVFLQLYRRLADIESFDHLGFWLRRVAANLAIDRLRRTPHEPLADDFEVSAPATGDDPLLTRELARHLGELAPAPRAVMVLRYQEDLDLNDIATALEMPVNTVKSHIKRSLTTLRSRMIGAHVVGSEELS